VQVRVLVVDRVLLTVDLRRVLTRRGAALLLRAGASIRPSARLR